MSCTLASSVHCSRESPVPYRMVIGTVLFFLLHTCLGFMIEKTYTLNFAKRDAVPTKTYKVGDSLRLEYVLETSSDTDIRCVKDDIVRRVQEVVVPMGLRYYKISNTVLLENMKVNDSGQYACIALMRGTNRSRALFWNVSVVPVLKKCTSDWRCNSAVLPTECSSACRCPNIMYSSGNIWRCSASKGTANLNISNRYGESYQHGDRILLEKNDNLVLTYEFVVDMDVVVTERLRGVESSSTVTLPPNSTQYKERRTVVLWNVTRSNTVLVRITLKSHPVVSNEIILPVVVIPVTALGMECMDDTDCVELNAQCLDRQCRCSFSSNVNGSCAKSCRNTSDCKAHTGTLCNNSFCVCPEGMVLFDGKCYPRDCESHYECSRIITNTVCYKGSCICKHGFQEINKACMPIVCSQDMHCQDTSMRCYNTSCTCGQDLVDHMGKCILRNMACISFADCPDANMVCINRSCICRSGFIVLNKKCVEVRQAVLKKSECFFDSDCGGNKVCLEQVCVCKKGTEMVLGFCEEVGHDIVTIHPDMKKIFIMGAGIGMSVTIAAAFIVCIALFVKKEEMEHAIVSNNAEVVNVSDAQWVTAEAPRKCGRQPNPRQYRSSTVFHAKA
ncbi:uncharacterized protein LOC135397155 isoform X2 [Ornithodoros turicata]|uniref:uncharacterized protein LOC135397155 isoform X2 n=1 Tax=Ornithodoros turicata TaxID=34597 RepID=UPI0031391DC6